MAESLTEYVTPMPAGGWRIAGTRVSLDSIVHAYWEGRLPPRRRSISTRCVMPASTCRRLAR